MTLPVVIGTLLLAGAGIAHSYLGERYVLIRLFRRTDLPQLFGSDVITRRIIRFAWHLTSVAWWGFAAVLVLAAQAGAVRVLRAVAGTFLVTGIVTLLASRGRHWGWLVFLAIAAAAWLTTPSL